MTGADALGAAARGAGVTGDTKVVDAGRGERVYVNTAGPGLVPDGVDMRPQRARPGNVIIVSGTSGSTGLRS